MHLPKALLVLSLLQLGLTQQDVLEEKTTSLEKPVNEQSRDTSSEAQQVYQQAAASLASLTSSDASSIFALSSGARGPVTAVIQWLKMKMSWRAKSRNGRGSKRGKEEVSGGKGQALKVVDLLEHAIELGSMDALYLLGEISLFPPSQHLPINASRAFQSYSRHAFLTGNSSSHFKVGFFYATGYGAAVQVDQTRALLEYTFAAHGEKGDGNGNKHAQMALGYRHWIGIGVNDNCMNALEWYESAAEQSMARFLKGPTGGKALPPPLVKLSDMAGGTYGFGSSAASTSFLSARAVIKSFVSKNAGEGVDDLIDYFEMNAAKGDLFSMYRLGKIYYQGSIYAAPGGIASGAEGVSLVPKDYAQAKGYFLRAARTIWQRDYPNKPSLGRRDTKVKSAKTEKDAERQKEEMYVAASAGYLGRMHLRGEGVRLDTKLARMWLERGAEANDRESLNGLGIMWRDGLIDGSKADPKKAGEYFLLAAQQNLAEAQISLGKHYYYAGDIPTASQYFEASLNAGNPYESYYYIAEIHAANARQQMAKTAMTQLSMSPEASCAIATNFYKAVAERGCWDEEYVKDGNVLWEGVEGGLASGVAGTPRGKEEALVRWLIAAEMGIEPAQNNIAYVLDRDRSSLRDPFYQTSREWSYLYKNAENLTSMPSDRLALTHWTRSAAQRNVDALVKLGDYHFYGIGLEPSLANETDSETKARLEKAAGYYQSAVDTQLSALAMWNLGWMYENGVGVAQDFHLAKRYYDMSLETNQEGYFPVVLSLLKLHVRSLWHAITGGTQREKTLLLWSEEAEGDGWYLGKSKADMKRRQNKRNKEMQEGAQEDDSLADFSSENDGSGGGDVGDFGPEDYFDAATRRREHGEGEEEEEDEFIETMILVGLVILVASLMYVRARWVDRRRQDEERAQQGPNAQPQPRPGEPEFDLMGLLQ